MDDAVLMLLNNDVLGNRAQLYERFTLYNISNIKAKSWFRFEKVHIPRLAATLGIPEYISTDDNITLSGIQ